MTYLQYLQYLPLTNGEVNLNLIEPASVDGGCTPGPRWAIASAGGRPPFGRDERTRHNKTYTLSLLTLKISKLRKEE